MHIIKKGVMPDGTKIQIEDWSEDYNCFSECGTLAAYPVAKKSIVKYFGNDPFDSNYYKDYWTYPEARRKFRLEFDFENGTDAEQAFCTLISGKSQLKDFADKMKHREYAECI